MIESPYFTLFIAALHWLLCARIYFVCIVPERTETAETVEKQPETMEAFAPLVDGVVDWGNVNVKK